MPDKPSADEPLAIFDAIIPNTQRALTMRGPAPRVMFEGFASQMDQFARMSGIGEGDILEVSIRLSKRSRVQLMNVGNDNGSTDESTTEDSSEGEPKAKKGGRPWLRKGGAKAGSDAG